MNTVEESARPGHPEHIVGTAADGPISHVGNVLEIHSTPLVASYQAPGAIIKQKTSPDELFPRPPRPAPPPTEPKAEADVIVQNTSDGIALPPSSIRAVKVVAGLSVATAMACWVRRTIDGRRSFDNTLSRLERRLRATANPARDARLQQGSMHERKLEAARQVETLESLIADGLAARRRSPWKAYGRSGRQLDECSRTLGKRLARIERAAEELTVIAEIERRLHAIDAQKEDVHDDDEMSGSDGEEQRGIGLETRHPTGGADSASELCRRLTSSQLMARARALQSKQPNGSAEAAIRCVFRGELEQLRGELERRERQALAQFKLGLDRWDLGKIDGALARARLLQRPDLVKKIQEKRDYVDGKLWLLQEEFREELREAPDHALGQGKVTSLRNLCVKADLFSATKWPEYGEARKWLARARREELEAQAQVTLDVYGLRAGWGYTLRVDPDSGQTLVRLDACQEQPQRSRSPALESDGRSPGVGRRLPLDDAAAVNGSTEGCNTSNGASTRGDGIEYAERHPCTRDGALEQKTTDSLAGLNGGSSIGDDGYMDESTGVHGGQLQLHVQGPLAWRVEKARADLIAYKNKREEEDRRHDAQYGNYLKRREEETLESQERNAFLDAREGEKMELKRERLRGEAEERARGDRERERRSCENRLAGLWSADDCFFLLLSEADACIGAATVAHRKGFSLSMAAILDALLALVVAECRKGITTGGDVHALDTPASCAVSEGMGSLLQGSPDDPRLCPAEATSDQGSGTSTLGWALSAAGSVGGATLGAVWSSAGWLLGQTVGHVSPDAVCETRAVFFFAAWLLSLGLAHRAAAWLGADGRGPGSTTTRLLITAVWVWGKFESWLLAASRELLLFVLPVPVFVLVYRAGLQYVERRRGLEGYWWAGHVRFMVSRALPTLVSCISAWILGLQST